MASLILGAVGTAIGGGVGGSILGISGAAIGGAVGTALGSVVDSALLSALMPSQRIEGQRLDTLRITSSTEGAVVPSVYGRMRVGGNIVWATNFREVKKTKKIKTGLFSSTKVSEYFYHASFAIALCEGPIAGIGRIWADGELLDTSDVTWRWYPGDETQEADTFIKAKMGAGSTPAYRGTAYVVFEDMEVTDFGNRIPQLSFEVFRHVADPDSAEGLVPAVTMIPGSGEFIYATQPVRKGGGGSQSVENLNAATTATDMMISLDQLQAMAPGVESVSLVVSWFGDDLRAGNCRVRPGVELSSKNTSPRSWSVNGVNRANAYLISRDDKNRPVYGGTPADFAVVQAIREMKKRGLRVTFYPFLMMDVPAGNALPDPYSDNAAGSGQDAFPWRGRITCSPAAGYAGSVDKTSAAASQVASLFGSATPAQFSVSGENVSWTGPAGEWSLRRMILHYAHLCKAAGGVDAFLIGSEMRGLTTIRSGASSYPAVQAFRDLAAAVRSILGAGTKIGYAADWSEYFGHHPQDGSGDVFFHLDPLWADPNIDFIGIDNYMPLSDWRDGSEHLDARAGWQSIYDRDYLQANIGGGEGFDWFYASPAARAAQSRTPITDGGAGKPWVFRYKDLRSWWSNQHFNRPGGVESGAPTAWVPQSKPIWFTELGCPAIDRGTNQPNVFVDPKSSESFAPYFSRGWRDDAVQRAYLEATYLYWRNAANNPVSSIYGRPMVHVPECAAWTWDARPYPFFPELEGIWSDGENWRLGHWLTGRLGSVSLAALVRHLCERAGLPAQYIDVSDLWGAVEGYAIGALESPRASISMLAHHFGFDAVESEGRIRFVMRGRAPAASVAMDDMVVSGGAGATDGGDIIELTRAQETELPQALKWSVARADEDYDFAVVESRRITVDASRVAMESFPVAVPPEDAERRCRRALIEAWAGRESAVFRLPPSRLALDPTDVLVLVHDDRETAFRLVSVADAEFRGIEAVRQDREAYDLPPGAPRATALATIVVFSAPGAAFLDLPQVAEDLPAHYPLIAAYADPWPGEMAVFRSPDGNGFELITTFTSRAGMGTLAADLYSGPTSRFDHGNSVYVDLQEGTLESVTDSLLFDGSNMLAVAQPGGAWEILQFGEAELIATGRYRLSRLLRGQRGTEADMAPMVPAGATVVVIDDSLEPLPVAEADLGNSWNWRIGPASLPVDDETYVEMAFAPRGIGLRPFAPVHVEQPWRHGRTPGDLTIRWVRRDRSLAADSWNALEIPMSEASEAWQVEILDGASVKRTLTSNASSVVYTGADQTADWGAPLGPGASLAVRIAQIGPSFGAGVPFNTTLWF